MAYVHSLLSGGMEATEEIIRKLTVLLTMLFITLDIQTTRALFRVLTQRQSMPTPWEDYNRHSNTLDFISCRIQACEMRLPHGDAVEAFWDTAISSS